MPNRILPPKEKLQELYDSGLSGREMAERLGLNLNTVISGLTRYGISTRTAAATKRIQKDDGRGPEPARYWLGKTQPPEMVEKRAAAIRGERHYLWKGGRHRREYRGVIAKEICSRCTRKQNLGIHHVNFDHYDGTPENLTVLCVSCHMSIHKQAYWDAIHDGRTPPRSNGPVGWEREVKNESVLDERSGDVVPY